MYIDQFTARGPLTETEIDELLDVAAKYTSRITVTCGDRSVHAPVLPWCWDTLPVRAGATVSVTAEGGRRGDEEDRLALREFVRRFQRAG